MSVYAVRHRDAVKIGFTDNVRKRFLNLLSLASEPLQFIGHMPGGRDVEAHLHARFSELRLRAEWFRADEKLLTALAFILDPEMPPVQKQPEVQPVPNGALSDAAIAATAKHHLRRIAAQRWPQLNHGDRIDALASALGWRRSRVSDFYHAHPRARLQTPEALQLSGFIEANPASELARKT